MAIKNDEEDEDSAAGTDSVSQSAQLERPLREGYMLRATMRCAKITFAAAIAVFPILADPVDINSVKQRLSHPLSRIKLIDQWAVDPDPFLTSTTSAKIGKTAIKLPVDLLDHQSVSDIRLF